MIIHIKQIIKNILIILYYFRNPENFSAKNLYSLIRWSPQKFQQWCNATQAATPSNSILTHEARVFAL